MNKLKELWFRVKAFCFYVKLAIKRWTSPRVYVVQYAYTQDGAMKYDAHLVRAVSLDLRAVTQYLQEHTDGTGLIIMGVSEVPWNMYNTPLLDIATKFVNKVDKIADTLTTEPQADEVEEDEEENDGTHMLR